MSEFGPGHIPEEALSDADRERMERDSRFKSKSSELEPDTEDSENPESTTESDTETQERESRLVDIDGSIDDLSSSIEETMGEASSAYYGGDYEKSKTLKDQAGELIHIQNILIGLGLSGEINPDTIISTLDAKIIEEQKKLESFREKKLAAHSAFKPNIDKRIDRFKKAIEYVKEHSK